MSASKAERWNKIRTPQINDTSKESKEQILDSLTQPVPPKDSSADENAENSTINEKQNEIVLTTENTTQDQHGDIPEPTKDSPKNRSESENTDQKNQNDNDVTSSIDLTASHAETLETTNSEHLQATRESSTTNQFQPEMLARFEELFKGVYHGAPDPDLLVEEAYTRITFLIENDLIQEFDKVASNERRGFIKQIVNTSLRMGLDMYAEWKSQQPKKQTKKTAPRPRRRGGR